MFKLEFPGENKTFYDEDIKIDVYNTHIEVYPYKKDDYPVIENMYTAISSFDGKEFPCGYLIENGILFLPRGTHIAKLESILNTRANFIDDSDEYEEMNNEHSSLYDPRDELQEDSINFLIKENNKQLSLNLMTGYGKTYCVAFSITKLKMKALIITPNEALKMQWIKTFRNMFDYKTSELMNIAGSNIIDGIMDDLIDYSKTEVFFVNHQTLRSYLTNNNGYALHKFFKKIKIGIKVYDESHMEFGNIILIDFYSNTLNTWYLTATFDRSDKSESKCFKRAFNSVINFGETESIMASEKHVIYHIVNINSRITPKQRATVIGYAGMSSVSYGKYAFFDDQNQTAYNAILKVLDLTKNIEGKTLIFVPLIDAVDDVVKKIKKVSDKSVAAYHSRCSKDEKESAEKKDIIVSTLKSLGTGKDIPGLRCVILAEPVASKVIAQQMFGRIRPYYVTNDKGEKELKDTFFFDIIDRSIPACTWWANARFKKIKELAKDIVTLNIDE